MTAQVIASVFMFLSKYDHDQILVLVNISIF